MSPGTREKMLETTTRLLRVQGYHGTGLNQILKESGTPKGSLYYHFPGGKEQLAAEAVSLSAKMMAARVQQAFDATTSVADAVTRMLEVFAQELEETDFQHGCPVATVALEVATTDGEVRKACQEAFQLSQSVLEKNLRRYGYSAEHAQGMAEFMITAFEGALLLSRARRETSALLNLRRVIPKLFP